jgi:hypothetical protein
MLSSSLSPIFPLLGRIGNQKFCAGRVDADEPSALSLGGASFNVRNLSKYRDEANSVICKGSIMSGKAGYSR